MIPTPMPMIMAHLAAINASSLSQITDSDIAFGISICTRVGLLTLFFIVMMNRVALQRITADIDARKLRRLRKQKAARRLREEESEDEDEKEDEDEDEDEVTCRELAAMCAEGCQTIKESIRLLLTARGEMQRSVVGTTLGIHESANAHGNNQRGWIAMYFLARLEEDGLVICRRDNGRVYYRCVD